MSVNNGLLVCGSLIFSPAENPCRQEWDFILMGTPSKGKKGADVPKTAGLQARCTEINASVSGKSEKRAKA